MVSIEKEDLVGILDLLWSLEMDVGGDCPSCRVDLAVLDEEHSEDCRMWRIVEMLERFLGVSHDPDNYEGTESGLEVDEGSPNGFK